MAAAGVPGTIYIYEPKRTLPLFVYSSSGGKTSGTSNDNSTSTSSSSSSSSSPKNVLLFIGGMWDALATTPYVATLAEHLGSGSSSSKWTVMHPLLSSSARQFGIASLDEDVAEISTAIQFIRSSPQQQLLGTSEASRIVLIGHSTGCQDVLQYVTAATRRNDRENATSRPHIQGAIIQAPVSDRDSMLHAIATRPSCRQAADECNRIAATTPPDAHASTLLPYHLTRHFLSSVPVLISRWLSLMSPTSPEHPGPDDKFSFDLGPDALAQTFGQLGLPLEPLPLPSQSSSQSQSQSQSPSPASLLVLLSGADECVAPGVDQAVLLARWQRAVASSPAGAAGQAEINPASGIVGSAKHNLAGESFAERWARHVDLPERVLKYLDEVAGGRQTTGENAGRGVGEEAWARWRRAKEALEKEKEAAAAAAAADDSVKL